MYVSTHRPAYICMYKIQTAQMQNAAIKRHCLRKLPSVPWCWGLSKRTRGSRNSFQEFQRLGRLIPGPARDRESDCPSPSGARVWPRPRLSITHHHSPFRSIRCEPVPARGPASRRRARLQAGPPGGARAQRGRPLRPQRSIANPPPTPKYWRESSQA